jgi:hypothetical protein
VCTLFDDLLFTMMANLSRQKTPYNVQVTACANYVIPSYNMSCLQLASMGALSDVQFQGCLVQVCPSVVAAVNGANPSMLVVSHWLTVGVLLLFSLL